jgi:transposase
VETSPHDPAGRRTDALRARAALTAAGDAAPASKSRRRGREIVVLREDGFSLNEIAERYGVSRERVRQILRANDGPASEEAVTARRRRAERAAEMRVGELLERWRLGDQLGDIAADLGMQAAMCSTMIGRFASEMDRAARRASIARTRGRARTYSDRDILDAVVLAATRLGEVPTPRQYGAVARELGLASLPTVLNRMGGWTNALLAAGMQSRSATRGTRPPRWTEDDCWRALLQVVQELDEIPTVRGYDTFCADRSDMPSSATIRKRLGPWSAIAAHLTAARTGALCSASAQAESLEPGRRPTAT